MTQKFHFITFGNQKYYNALNRICNQAKELNIFDSVFAYNDKILFEYEDFQIHKEFISNNSRGFGYWIWKPFIVLKEFEKMKDGDILVYSDAGCSVKSTGVNRMKEYFDMINTNENSVIGFQLEDFHPEKRWCKADLLKFMNLDEDKYKDSRQLVGGIFVIKKNPKMIKLIEEWYEICCNYHLIDDTPSIEKNDISFMEHRHDQSVLSLLRKKYGCILLEDETYTSPNWDETKPIWATRNSN
jgi:hypothetical protein